MKKYLCLIPLFLFFVLLFTSCSTKSIYPFETQKTSALSMTAEKDGTEFKADVFCYSDGNMKIDFTSPEMMKGFCIKTDNGKYSIDAYGITDCIAYEELNDNSFLNLLVNTYSTAVFANPDSFLPNPDENGYSAKLTVSGIPVITVFDNEGYLSEIKAPQASFTAKFEKMQNNTE